MQNFWSGREAVDGDTEMDTNMLRNLVNTR